MGQTAKTNFFYELTKLTSKKRISSVCQFVLNYAILFYTSRFLQDTWQDSNTNLEAQISSRSVELFYQAKLVTHYALYYFEVYLFKVTQEQPRIYVTQV